VARERGGSGRVGSGRVLLLPVRLAERDSGFLKLLPIRFIYSWGQFIYEYPQGIVTHY
jgi:hypothetical protein